MKFTDGNWLMREGVTAFYPAEAHDIESSEDSVTVYATRRINHRGDTLTGPLLTVEISSPMADVVRVKLTHFAGQQPRLPKFAVARRGAPNVHVANDPGATTLRSGQLAVRIAHGAPWHIDFLANDRILTSSGPRAMGSVEVAGQGHFMHEQLSLDVGENVYGLGERFTAFVKNGQLVESWNRDGGTGSDQAYKNVPFYLTNRGYGVLVNHPEDVAFEIATEKVSRVQFSVAGQSLEYFIIYGPTPKQVLENYTALSGRPALPPPWSFGLWLTTSFTTSYDEATVTSFIQGMADRNLPLHVFHFDCFWMREFQWCDFEWDARVFSDPRAMLARLKARGLKISVWINSYLGQRSPLFAEAAQAGYLLKRPNGDVWQWDLWQPGMGVVDFTNPAACEWYATKLRGLLEMGVDCFKTDFGERIPTDVVYYDGSDPYKMHNYYSYLYNKVVFEVLQQHDPHQAVVFARSATTGGQRFPVHWGGDCDSTFPSMAESLRGGLSLGLSGFGFWSHDIGGFEGLPNAELYKRWIAFGLLSSHSRLHGSSSYRVPWLFDEESVDVLRGFTQLKCQFMPYLFGHAVEATQRGLPVMRAMLLEFPEDPTCDYLDRQYMLGDALLVAPVFSASGEVTYYLPKGRWTNFFNNQEIQGGGWQREQHDVFSLPLLVRPNSVIPFGGQTSRPDYDYAENLTLRVYALDAEATITTVVPDEKGDASATFTTRSEGNIFSIERQGANKPWQVLFVNIHTYGNVRGCAVEKTPAGLLVTPEAGATRIELGRE